jgi:hypothetical protein
LERDRKAQKAVHGAGCECVVAVVRGLGVTVAGLLRIHTQGQQKKGQSEGAWTQVEHRKKVGRETMETEREHQGRR